VCVDVAKAKNKAGSRIITFQQDNELEDIKKNEMQAFENFHSSIRWGVVIARKSTRT
jgi:hypothetical protein